MKRISAILLGALLCLTLAACSNSTENSDTPANSSSLSEEQNTSESTSPSEEADDEDDSWDRLWESLENYEEEEEELAASAEPIPESVDYKMACLVNETLGDSDFWHAHQVFVIEILDAPDNRFYFPTFTYIDNYHVIDVETGHEYNSFGFEDDKIELYTGRICLTDEVHFGGLEFRNEDSRYIPLWESDRDILTLSIYSKTPLNSPENIEFTTPMYYKDTEESIEETFTMNADASEISINKQNVVHRSNPCLFEGAYYYPEVDVSGGVSGEGYSGESYAFKALSADAGDKAAIREHFVPVQWDVDAQKFVRVRDEIDGYRIEKFPLLDDGDELEIGWTVFAPNGEMLRGTEQLDTIGTIYPAYELDDGTLMCFAW